MHLRDQRRRRHRPTRSSAVATVTVSAAPAGNFEEVGRLYDIVVVKGWAIDPDTGAPIAVKTRIDGVDVATGDR